MRITRPIYVIHVVVHVVLCVMPTAPLITPAPVAESLRPLQKAPQDPEESGSHSVRPLLFEQPRQGLYPTALQCCTVVLLNTLILSWGTAKHGNVLAGCHTEGGFPPPSTSSSPRPQNFEVEIFLILSSSLGANFQPFWSPKSDPRARKFLKFPGGTSPPHSPRGRGSMHMFLPTPTEKFCMKPCVVQCI